MNERMAYCKHLFDNLKRSIISTHVLAIDIYRINTCVKGHKWIETVKRFQYYKYEVYYIKVK